MISISEKDLMSNWVAKNLPLVSVTCIAYNHEKFIEQAIEGILMQKTNFPFEVIIHDDASTDTTQQIINHYAKKFPNVIIPILQKENYWLGKGISATSTIVWPSTKGKYIAWIEGDDYWTDPLKLQKQVDFLEANEDFAICHHNMQIIYENAPEKNRLSNTNQKEITTTEDLAKGNYIYTASCVFRKYDYKLPNWFEKLPIGDYPLHLLNSRYGKIKYINEVMGVYRVHDGGVWEHTPHLNRMLKWVNLLDKLVGYFDKKTNKILLHQQILLLKTLVDGKSEFNLLYSQYIFLLLNYYIKKIKFRLC